MTRNGYGFVPRVAIYALVLALSLGSADARSGQNAVADGGSNAVKPPYKGNTKPTTRNGKAAADNLAGKAGNGDERFDPKKFFEERYLNGGGM